jgi:ABC-type lipoprotein export system ATPase subunit
MAESGRLDMILVMGVTGSGKSYFCNKLAGREAAQEGSGLSSCKLLPFEPCDNLPVASSAARC